MDGVKGLFDSKKAFFTLLFFVACTVFVLVERMTIDQWMQAVLIALGGYFAAETTNAVMAPKPKAPAVTVAGGEVKTEDGRTLEVSNR